MKSSQKSTGQKVEQSGKPSPGQLEADNPVLGQLEKRKQLYASFGYDIERERKAVIEAALPLSGRILDAGTGKGHLAAALAKLGYRLVSFDLSEEQLEAARDNLENQGLLDLVELKKENGEQLSFPDGSFDVIFSVNMVHHLEWPLAVLSELVRVLQPGGKLIISDFSPEGLAMMAEVHRREGGEHQVLPFGLDQVEEFLLEKGFRVNRSSTRFQITLVASKP
ncbi:MAG: class I SAM-dependent methyltransferase [Candidatus Saccharicenans sp.]|uniref:class I SAM-dependent methyltransferase n=1 Tax=Candidatus Saccharicenans sp. TaxID=2819258 RepID=UPI00404A5B61